MLVAAAQEELDRIRRQAAEKRTSHAAEVSLAFAQATAQPQQPAGYDTSAGAADYQPEAPPQLQAELLRTLKVSWDKQTPSLSYGLDELREIMSKHGPVEDIILKESKKKKKGSALVVMQTLDAARAASEAVSGRRDNPLLVIPFAKAVAPTARADSRLSHPPDQEASPEAYAPAQPQQQQQSQPTFPLSRPATTPTPPSSPVKIRNPFSDSSAVGHASGSEQLPPQAHMPSFAAGAAAFGAAPSAGRPLFAAGAGMSSSTTSASLPEPFAFGSSSSYSSFPGAHHGAAGQSQGFGQGHFGASLQAGVKRCTLAIYCANIARSSSKGPLALPSD